MRKGHDCSYNYNWLKDANLGAIQLVRRLKTRIIDFVLLNPIGLSKAIFHDRTRQGLVSNQLDSANVSGKNSITSTIVLAITGFGEGRNP